MEPSDDQIVVIDYVVVLVKPVRDLYLPVGQINGLHVARIEIDPSQQLAYRVHDVAEVKIAGGHFVQHRREKEKILAVDQRYLNIGIAGDGALQADCGIQAAKAPAQDENFLALAHDNSAISQNTLMAPLPEASCSKSAW